MPLFSVNSVITGLTSGWSAHAVLLRWFRRWLVMVLGWVLAVAAVQAQPASAKDANESKGSMVTVAAASDLKFALEELVPLFEKASGHRVKLVLGSSGNLFAQIAQGAPFHVFMSADEGFVFKLADAGKTRDRGRLYALGRIGLMVPHGSPL